ncbi:MAG: LamB/YcsF family protein, partial [Rhodospirillaceae bacterium]
GSCLFQAGEQVGLPTAGEIFSDRTYQEDGTLTPRSQPDAMIHEPSQSVAQILRFLEAGGIVTPSGAVIKTPIHSVCVHGDSQGALAIAQSLRQELGAAGVTLCALQDALG